MMALLIQVSRAGALDPWKTEHLAVVRGCHFLGIAYRNDVWAKSYGVFYAYEP
jgi:hypothetical protein